MAVRQYIGARYAPKFSDVNSGVWSNVYSYEPLTIVKNGNDYYTSKKSVPVGVAITDTEYWIKTGDYNGAIASLDTRLDTVESEIRGGFTNRKFLLHGDSYLMQSPSWGNYVAQSLGLSSDQYVTLTAPGSGFVNAGSLGVNFIEQLEAYPTINGLTDIVVVGGANDRNTAASSTIKHAVIDYIERAQLIYGNVKIWVAMPANSPDYTESINITRRVYQGVMQGAIAGGATFINDASFTLNLKSDFLDDIHPTAQGSERLGYAISNGIRGQGYVDEVSLSSTVTCLLDNTQTFTLRAQILGTSVMYQITPAALTTAMDLASSPITLTAGSYTRIAEFTDYFCTGNFATGQILANIRLGASDWITISFDVRVGDGLYIRPLVGITDVQYIRFGQINVSGPLRRGN